jgi:asparagine synthase (glutamine-hydrolysing)
VCGICGVLARGERPVPAEPVLRGMLATLVHRGPDDEGLFTDGRVALGSRRLSVIDVEGGHQPLATPDGAVQVLLNGEIYNYRELRRELESQGARLRTRSDTETVAHLYQRRGLDFLAPLNGMFALAVWDARRRRLVLARDRLGIKPLYYWLDDAFVVFASEIKPLLASTLVPPVLDAEAARDYSLMLQVPAPRAILRGVRKLAAGHLLVVEGEAVTARAYWRPPAEAPRAGRLRDQADELRALFDDAVALQMRSDVPYGAFLSGGVDSGAIVAAMAVRSPTPVKTFSIGFPGHPRHDERAHARTVARRFGTEHHEVMFEPPVVGRLPEIVYYFDEPFADAAMLPTFTLAEFARRHVTVVLTGDGGDEIFAGYDRYRSEVLGRWAERLPAALRHAIVAGAERHPLRADRPAAEWLRQAVRKLSGLDLPEDERYARHFQAFTPAGWREVAGEALRSLSPDQTTAEQRAIFSEAGAADFLGRRMYFDVRTSLPDQMLTKVDRATMAHGLEARVPFLDHRLVEFALRLPQEAKFRPWRLKHLPKVAFAGRLPRSLLHRRKHGFELPLDEWLRGPLRAFVRDTLTPAALAGHGVFDGRGVSALIDAHEARRRNCSREIFGILVFQLWWDRWLGPGATRMAPAPAAVAATR